MRMPMASVVLARLRYHSGRSRRLLPAANAAVLVLLIFALGFLLHPNAGFLAGLAVVAASCSGAGWDVSPDSLYTLLVLMTAGLLVWRARAPTTGRTVLLAAAAGASLLWRSPLAFFTPVLAVYECLLERRFGLPAARKQILILCVVPYLFLLPWIAMNWSVHRRLVIFERGAASRNIAAGAAGLVGNIEGDIETLAGEPIDATNTGAVVGWAVREVIRHPIRYARAYVLRAAFALSTHPWTALLAVGGFWVSRRRRDLRELSLLAAYFLGVYCFMAVEPRYFDPLWPLAGMIACSLPSRLRLKNDSAAEASEFEPASYFLSAALLGVLLISLFAGWKVLAYARLERRDAEAEFSDALRASPDDAWLYDQRGEARFSRGDFSGAAQDFTRAVALEPNDPALLLNLARAEALLGRSGRLLSWRAPRTGSSLLPIDAAVLISCDLLRSGREREGRERLRAARDAYRAYGILVRGPQGELEKRALAELRTSDSGFVAYVRGLEGPRPDAETMGLYDALAEIEPNSFEVWIGRAAVAAKLGRRDKAREYAAQAEKFGADSDAKALELVGVYRDINEDRRAIAWLAALTERRPDDAGLIIERARLLRRLKEGGAADALLESLSRSRPDDGEILIERAELALEMGRSAQALDGLARAAKGGSSGNDDRLLERIAHDYQSLKAYDRAIEVLDGLTRHSPASASLYSDKGLCEYLAGRGDAALADLGTSIRLDPRFLPASLTLGAIETAKGSPHEAMKVYDAALAASPEDSDPLRLKIVAARRALHMGK